MPQAVMKWSPHLNDFYNKEIQQPIFNHTATDFGPPVKWCGYSSHEISTQILKRGLADFSEGYEALTAEDKIQLYCFFNMRLHFFESLATFKHYGKNLKTLLARPEKMLMIDLGCGPGTAGLAMGEFASASKLNYAGIDISIPMSKKAKALLKAAVEFKVIDKSSTFTTTSSWKRLISTVSNCPLPNVLINATYLFASHSLDIRDVLELVNTLQNSKSIKKTAVYLYQFDSSTREPKV